MQLIRFFVRSYALFAVLLAMLLPGRIAANAISGGEITWQHIGGDSFLVKVTYYKDCATSSPWNWHQGAAIPLSCSNASSQGLNLQFSAGQDVTPVCLSNCTQCSNSSCSFSYGFRKYVSTTIVRLTNCCNWRIYYQSYARSSDQSTGLANTYFYVTSTINSCSTLKDNSPVFNSEPKNIVCTNQCLELDFSASDPDEDSLVYSLTPILGYNGQTQSYSGNYRYNKPAYYQGFPSTNLSYSPPNCRGFHLDSATGKLYFKALTAQRTAFAVKVESYRNGTKIGEVLRETELVIINCPSANSVPSITGINKTTATTLSVCKGDTAKFSIFSSDGNNSDSVYLSVLKPIAGAKYTTITGKTQSLNVEWPIPDSIPIGSSRVFWVYARDNACPLNATTIREFTIHVSDTPAATYTVAESPCGEVCFDANSTFNNLSYHWAGEGGLLDSVPDFCYEYGAAGKYRYSLTVSNNACSKKYRDSVVYLRDDSLQAKINGPLTICPGDSVHFTLNVTGAVGYYTAKWLPANHTGNTFSFLPANAQWVYAEITDSAGCMVKDSAYFTINPQSQITFNLVDSFCKSSDTVNLNALPAGGTWAGANTSPAGEFYIENAVPGIHKVYYEAADANNCSLNDSATITILPNPVTDAGADFALCIDAGPAQLNPSPPGGTWLGTGVVNNTFSTQGLSAGNYLLRYEYFDQFGCFGEDSLTVTINGLPVVEAGNDTTICLTSAEITLPATPAGATWSGPNLNGNTFMHADAGPGTYKFVNFFTDPATGCSNKDSLYITVFPPPAVDAGTDTGMCLGAAGFVLTPQPAGGQWQGTGIANGKFEPAMAGAGLHELVYTITDNNNCQSSDTIYIEVFPPPQVDAGNDFTVCETSGNVQLNGQPQGGTWSGKGIYDFAGILFDPKTAGIGQHLLVYTFTGQGNCMARDSVIASVRPAPTAQLSSSITNGYVPLSVVFTDEIAGNDYTRTWSVGQNVVSTDQSFVHTFTDTGIFTVYLIVENAYGCKDQDMAVIKVLPPIYVHIPDAFTPDNGDEVNDVFNVVVSEAVTSFEMHIFNRWGGRVYETTNINKGWDGRGAPAGLYFYNINITDPYNGRQELKGRIWLIR